MRLGYTQVACTDKPCAWNNDFIKKIEGERIKDIKFYSSKKGQVPKRMKYADASITEQKNLLEDLVKLNPRQQPVVLSLFSNVSSNFHHKDAVPQEGKIPTSLRSYYTSDSNEVDQRLEQINSLAITQADIDFIYKTTMTQSDSIVWRETRIGRITSSNAHKVLHTDFKNPATSVVLEITKPSEQIFTPAIQWGKVHEPIARKAYEKQLKTLHPKVRITEAGLLLDSQNHFIGASTDGFGSCNCKVDCEYNKFLVEIKCTFKHREKKTIEECLEDKSFWHNPNDKTLKKNHPYMTQVQMQLYVHKLKKCHFVTWNPNFCHSVIISYDESFPDKIDKLKLFHKTFICRELVTRTIETANKKNVTKAPELFCFCQQPNNENEEMIGCDNAKCKYKWIHYTCINPPMKRPPKGIWFCKYCKKNTK